MSSSLKFQLPPPVKLCTYVHTYEVVIDIRLISIYGYTYVLCIIYLITYVDQTPTPTRFLKICDQEGLFDSLKDSPFDQVS